jgi:hypothetical protein
MKYRPAELSRSYRAARGLLTATLLALAVLFCTTRSAFACQCQDGGGSSLVWPLDGAALTLEPVFVVQGSATDLHLFDQQGSEVALHEFRTIPETEGCSGPTRFLRTDGPLVAQGYELRSASEPKNAGYSVLARFTAVPGLVISDAPEPSLAYYRFLPRAGCERKDGKPCLAQAEVSVTDGTVASPDDVSWLILQTGSEVNMSRLGGTAQGYPKFYLALDQAYDDACVDVELVNARGVTQRSETLCEPRACAVDLDVGTSRSSCSSNPSATGERLWGQVDPGPCDQPAQVRRGAAGGLVVTNYGEEEPVPGCSVTQRHLALPWACFMAALALSVRRARGARFRAR